MSFLLAPAAEQAARQHALDEYPRESCGLIVDGAYLPAPNMAANPEQDFKIAGAFVIPYKGRIQAIVHSHPNGPLFPSASDMRGQLATRLPWVIIPTWGENCGHSIIWGDHLPPLPVIGRPFVHGVSDCYTLIKDVFRLGRDELAKQDILNWPFDPVPMDEFPREDNWWSAEGDRAADDLYSKGFASQGFKITAREALQPGDIFLLKIKSDQLNHGGILLDNNLILHHLPNRLSRREPAGIWARAADLWIRYEGQKHAS